MATQNEPARLIAAAAKEALAPLGFRRKGQSRVWLSDERFWLLSVEFQPSGWSKGSFLNLGPVWLWTPGGSLDFTYRPVDFVPFEDAERFAPRIVALAQCAAREALALRQRFPTVAKVQQHYAHGQPDRLRTAVHSALTAGLVGDFSLARSQFTRIRKWSDAPSPAQAALQEESAILEALVDDPARFKAAVLAIIAANRVHFRLPPDPICLDGGPLPARHGA